MLHRFTSLLISFIIISTCSFAQAFAVETTIEEVKGNWNLRYSDGFGYEFRFKDNYRAYVALNIKGMTLVFRGIYTIDDGDILRINISEIKEQSSKSGIEKDKGFVKTGASVFLFQISEINSTKLTLIPQKIQIDGRRSDGYFEPTIKLKKH